MNSRGLSSRQGKHQSDFRGPHKCSWQTLSWNVKPISHSIPCLSLKRHADGYKSQYPTELWDDKCVQLPGTVINLKSSLIFSCLSMHAISQELRKGHAISTIKCSSQIPSAEPGRFIWTGMFPQETASWSELESSWGTSKGILQFWIENRGVKSLLASQDEPKQEEQLQGCVACDHKTRNKSQNYEKADFKPMKENEVCAMRWADTEVPLPGGWPRIRDFREELQMSAQVGWGQPGSPCPCHSPLGCPGDENYFITWEVKYHFDRLLRERTGEVGKKTVFLVRAVLLLAGF